jgi:predicted Zn-dependent protease
MFTSKCFTHRLKFTLAAGAAVGLAAVGAGCQSGQIHNNVMNTEQENALGREYASEIDSQAKFVMDGKTNRRVLDIAAPVFAQAQKEAPDVSFRIRVIDSPEVNAFSIPGGYVYIYQGLLNKIGPDDDALACIIGHESAHVVRRHVVKSISDSENKGFLVDLATLLSRSNTVGNLGGALFELDQLHYSREAEFEADRWGERFAYNAGYDPTGMVRTFQTFEKMEDGGNSEPSYAQDHPINENRILRVEEQLRELRADHGTYVSEAYDPNGDRIAAKEHDLDYHLLVLSTNIPAPLPAAKTGPAEHHRRDGEGSASPAVSATPASTTPASTAQGSAQ